MKYIAAWLLPMALFAWFWLSRARSQSDFLNTLPPSSVMELDPRYSCGVTALTSITAWCGQPVSLASAEALLEPNLAGDVSLAQLDQALQQLGYSTAAVQITTSSCSKIELPAILFQHRHFSVAVPVSGGFLEIDPPRPLERREWHHVFPHTPRVSIILVAKTNEILSQQLRKLDLN